MERLPNELLIEILSYISMKDLYYSWLNLNNRFSGLLSFLKFHIESERDEESLRYFALQVISLETNKLNIIEYPYLRSLKLHLTEVDLIRHENFPHLEYLSLVETMNFNFENVCQLKSLRSFQVKSLAIDTQCSYYLSSIKSLTLGNCDPSKLIHLLRHLPKLIFLKLTIFWSRLHLYQFDSTDVFIHPNLKSLNLSMLDTDFGDDISYFNANDVILSLLSCVSPCKGARCKLTSHNILNLNFEQIQDIVIRHNFFSFTLIFIHTNEYESSFDFNYIKQFPLFNQVEPLIVTSSIGYIYKSKWINPFYRS